MKDEQDNPFGDSAAGSAEGEAANNGGITLDDLFQEEVDQAQADDINRSALAPAGTYTSNPEEAQLNASVVRLKDKDADGNETGTERTVITLTGRVTAQIKGKTETAGLRVRMSPDRRKAKVYVDGEPTGELSEKDDAMSKLWAQAVAAFGVTFNDKPKSKGAVVEYLTNHPVRFRLMQVGVPTKTNPEPRGEPGNLVVAISPLRAKKK